MRGTGAGGLVAFVPEGEGTAGPPILADDVRCEEANRPAGGDMRRHRHHGTPIVRTSTVFAPLKQPGSLGLCVAQLSSSGSCSITVSKL